jgi:glycosyltransferase involved in cell wall biosynthesis
MLHYAPLRAGWRIRKKYGGKYFVYFVDAVPAPKPFLKDQKYIDQLSKYIKNYCDNVDIVFSATEEMSKYQSTIINNPNIIFCELYNPSKTNNLVFFTDKSKELAFTYTGNIYPPRNPRYLLDAFARFLKLYPNANLNIIGNNIANYFDSFLKDYPKSVQKQICILPFKKDLSTAFNNSTALIDLGCEVENDVYMSNKINGYFSYCRPIICETSQNSPAARVFKELSSVIICNHNSDEIYNAMMKVISDDYIVDYTERYRILKEMSINGVAQKILDLYNEQ